MLIADTLPNSENPRFVMKIAYARCSEDEQNLHLQLDAFEMVGVDKVYFDQGVSATQKKRPGLEAALAALTKGDQFVIWKLDRPFRSLSHALTVLDHIEKLGAEFMDITEGIDTKTPFGRCIYQIRSAFAELELNLIKERTIAGMAAAKKRGIHCGRPRKLSRKQVQHAKKRKSSGDTIASIAHAHKVHPSTISRAINDR